MESRATAVLIEPWSEDDLDLLRAINAPELMAHLGGPETEEKLLDRHRRYVALSAAGADASAGQMYRIVVAATGEAAGGIGFWEHVSTSDGLPMYETGWTVLAGFQGRGLASRATALVIGAARAAGRHRYLFAYPKVSNGASNAVCRKVGFELLGQVAMEYPPGHPITSNEWRLDLRP
ncbi:GNAT family N-acetyltransferase [Streptomyces sp. NPDC047315]|uniref:GNAT family N-acetyltransferase n=1 Tax=Streptomyces sp. NPDC047315 TaxID=3155142 RepID=UPI0033EC6926